MAKRRRVSNLMALAVLSVVVSRPMHPYEMATALRAWGKDQDIEIKWGSLYTVVHNLEKHGMIEAIESGRQGRRPERTVYRVTDEGRAELADWARELLCVPSRERPRFLAGLSVMAALPPEEVRDLLRQRLEGLDRRISESRESLDRSAGEVPRLFLVEGEYELAMTQAEADWVRALLDDLRSGSFPDLHMWRHFHDTGQVPTELAELTERKTAT